MSYLESLKHTIAAWCQRPIQDEWLFESFREDVVGMLPPAEAYKQIDPTLDILVEQTDESTVVELLETVMALAQVSNTTEPTSNIRLYREAIYALIKNYDQYATDKFEEILHYYRV